jgi:hypothetical protein
MKNTAIAVPLLSGECIGRTADLRAARAHPGSAGMAGFIDGNVRTIDIAQRAHGIEA